MIWIDYTRHVDTGHCQISGVGYERGNPISESQWNGTCGRIFINDPVFINGTKGQYGIQ